MTHFAREKVEIAVLEVGMGGRLDATNVVEPLVSVITDISLDHQKFLGNTVGEIAREKVGIIRPGGVVVTLPQQPEANDVIGNTILDLDAHGVSAVQYVPPVSPGSTEYRVASTEKDLQVRTAPPLFSRYPLQVMGKQIWWSRRWRAGTSCGMSRWRSPRRKNWPSSWPSPGSLPESIERGIRETRWPGRFQVIPASAGWPEIVLRCGAQSGGSVGPALRPFGAV